MRVEIRRGSTRFQEREPGRVTRHSFAFGSDYDPARLSFGPMVCHDDHLLGPGRGFETHRHSGLEIITYVVSGAQSGTVALQADRRTARFQPTAGFHGLASFAFTVTGSDGSAYTSQVVVMVAP